MQQNTTKVFNMILSSPVVAMYCQIQNLKGKVAFQFQGFPPSSESLIGCSGILPEKLQWQPKALIGQIQKLKVKVAFFQKTAMPTQCSHWSDLKSENKSGVFPEKMQWQPTTLISHIQKVRVKVVFFQEKNAFSSSAAHCSEVEQLMISQSGTEAEGVRFISSHYLSLRSAPPKFQSDNFILTAI